MLDLISGGRIISGFVRGTGVEQLSTNANPAYNRERFEEAFQLIKKAWTVPGPFRWEGKHYHLRVVNPWQLPLQKPHPPIWAAGILSPETIRWAAKQRITYLVLGSALEATASCREIYHEVARAGRLDADAAASRLPHPHLRARHGRGGLRDGPPSLRHVAPASGAAAASAASAVTQGTGSAGVTSGGPHPEWYGARPATCRNRRRPATWRRSARASEGSYEAANRAGLIVTGSPKTIIQKFKHIIDRTDPGYLTFWAREGKKPHEATMRGIELLGKEVIPALREHQSALVTGKEVTPWPQMNRDTEQLIDAAGIVGRAAARRQGRAAPRPPRRIRACPAGSTAYARLAETLDVIVPSLPGYGRIDAAGLDHGRARPRRLGHLVRARSRPAHAGQCDRLFAGRLGRGRDRDRSRRSSSTAWCWSARWASSRDKGEIFDYFLDGGLTGLRRAFHRPNESAEFSRYWGKEWTPRGRRSRRAASRDDVPDCLEAIHAQPDAAALPSGDQSSDPADLGPGGCHNPTG